MKKLLLILLCVPLIGFSQETGCVSGDCKNGYGTYIFDNGHKYVGEFKNSEKHGLGTFRYWPDDALAGTLKNKYVGEFKNGEKHGLGTFTYGHGNKYAGEWKGGRWNGQGTLYDKNGDKYAGEFKDGNPNGQGTMTYADGTVEKGLLENAKLKNSFFFDFYRRITK